MEKRGVVVIDSGIYQFVFGRNFFNCGAVFGPVRQVFGAAASFDAINNCGAQGVADGVDAPYEDLVRDKIHNNKRISIGVPPK